MKVLVITYYWVPAGGSGVQRWLKFVKYLRDYGIEPVVFTVENPKYPLTDVSLEEDVPDGIEVVRNPIFEPNDILSVFKKKQTKTSAGFLNPNPNFIQKCLQYVRANYFIPDARKYWIKPSVKKIKSYLQNNTVDTIITTGPPHSMHMIGLELKKQLGVRWIADFRDPWTDIDYFHQLPLTKKSIQKHQKLEQEVLKTADDIIVVGKTMKDNYDAFSNNVHVITNGYDTEQLSLDTISLDAEFSITHIGLMNADRNPKVLWKVLSEIAIENEAFSDDLVINLVGEIANEVTSELAKYQFKNVRKIGYVQHQEVVRYQKQSQVLLLAVNNVPSAKMIITGKIFEYLQAERPILAIGPSDGDLAAILKMTNAGKVIDFEDSQKMKSHILSLYQQYKNQDLKVNSIGIQQYHRKNLTAQLAKIIKKE